MTLLLVLILVLTAVAVGSAVYYLGGLTQQVQYVILADGRRQERSLPMFIRAVLPLTSMTPKLLQGGPWKTAAARLDRKILSSGFDSLINGRELMLCQMWLGGMGFLFGLLLGRGVHAVGLLLTVALFAYPRIWLKGALAERHRHIQRGLPYVLDLLTLCVEAGLDFMSALAKIAERRKMDPLGEELMRVFHAIRLGRTRRQALREMRDRVDLPDLTVVVNALTQADELGVSLGAILRIQADQLRTKRFQRAETLANQAPTKMLLPLVFIFVAAFIILLGPVLLQVFQRLM
ncbi:MAG: type II secretion system F family protein [Verrucomicrobiae bacterium]|nr:type II secretion system F family protein [Verrucomicrobiae bacterium]